MEFLGELKQDGAKVTPEQCVAVDALHKELRPIFDRWVQERNDVLAINLIVTWL